VWSLVLTGVLAVSSVAGMEIFWRSMGQEPSIPESPAAWAVRRGLVKDAGEETLVLVGASRIMGNFSVRSFQRRHPEMRVVSLAISGESPTRVLRDLAEDKTFAGRVVVSTTPYFIAKGQTPVAEEYVRTYHEDMSLNNYVDQLIGMWVESRLAVVRYELHPRLLISEVRRKRRLPEPTVIATHFDGSRHNYYHRMDDQTLREMRTDRVSRAATEYRRLPRLVPEVWDGLVDEIAGYADRIEARGGRVVFVRMPTSGEHLAMDLAVFPRERFWDRLAARVNQPAIHFMDEQSLSSFECPDTSHLDYIDKDAFTLALCDAMQESGFLDPPLWEGGARYRIAGLAERLNPKPADAAKEPRRRTP